ncbi:hypothetical protein [Arthrobacter sp. CAN_C5]|uniref:hypothetical protein n=1 Tax=Arthrobacter sp. CAN_C5 TaxID=2760706 RepID=UPI001AE8B06F|nr:hypothetical protein [Arthrobacter sp. CAN_C5]MBP2215120.1 hypothetical protein [Arthrobacter sp. CAN_C5]
MFDNHVHASLEVSKRIGDDIAVAAEFALADFSGLVLEARRRTPISWATHLEKETAAGSRRRTDGLLTGFPGQFPHHFEGLS